jgi:hypothetical protein
MVGERDEGFRFSSHARHEPVAKQHLVGPRQFGINDPPEVLILTEKLASIPRADRGALATGVSQP